MSAKQSSENFPCHVTWSNTGSFQVACESSFEHTPACTRGIAKKTRAIDVANSTFESAFSKLNEEMLPVARATRPSLQHVAILEPNELKKETLHKNLKKFMRFSWRVQASFKYFFWRIDCDCPGEWQHYYNWERPHSDDNGKTYMERYAGSNHVLYEISE